MRIRLRIHTPLTRQPQQTQGEMMIGRFNMAGLEPPDDSAWHLAVDHYETSGDMDEDALDWLSDANFDDDQMATIRDWFRQSSKFATAIDNRLAGEA